MIKVITSEWCGLMITGMWVTGQWEGDPSIPNGVHRLPDELEDICIYSPENEDITDYFTAEAIEAAGSVLFDTVEKGV
jgi:hypothetical protein